MKTSKLTTPKPVSDNILQKSKFNINSKTIKSPNSTSKFNKSLSTESNKDRSVKKSPRNVTIRNIKENVNKVSLKSPAIEKLKEKRMSTPGSIQRRKEYNPKANVNKPLSYKPYTGALKPLTNRDILKNKVNKNSNTKSSLQIKEGQKVIIKGVRMNKRFELQMARRGLKN